MEFSLPQFHRLKIGILLKMMKMKPNLSQEIFILCLCLVALARLSTSCTKYRYCAKVNILPPTATISKKCSSTVWASWAGWWFKVIVICQQQLELGSHKPFNWVMMKEFWIHVQSHSPMSFVLFLTKPRGLAHFLYTPNLYKKLKICNTQYGSLVAAQQHISTTSICLWAQVQTHFSPFFLVPV